MDLWPALTLSLVMSHLACADEPDHPKSEAQRKIFDRLRAQLPATPASLANSAGILLGPDFVYDLVRPGLALYGGHPRRHGENPFQPVVQLKGRILQVRNAAPGETVGYGATRTLREPARVAVVSVGYADGFFRALSVADGEEGFAGYLGPHAAPIVGRVSMDLITLDVSLVPEAFARRGAWVELIGPNVPRPRPRRAMPAPSITRSSPISAGAPSGAISGPDANPWPKPREPLSAKPAAR